MGADVNHPAPGDSLRPSFCSVIASMDSRACRYSASLRAQGPRVEIISDLEAMTVELFKVQIPLPPLFPPPFPSTYPVIRMVLTQGVLPTIHSKTGTRLILPRRCLRRPIRPRRRSRNQSHSLRLRNPRKRLPPKHHLHRCRETPPRPLLPPRPSRRRPHRKLPGRHRRRHRHRPPTILRLLPPLAPRLAGDEQANALLDFGGRE